MEHPISPLAFSGSISDAILQVKTQRKLLVVHLSEGNSERVRETSTWTESNAVSEALSKYCILIHILDGSTDAAHLNAIYPQKPVPCITVIGYNGVLLWQTELVSAENLASNLEKIWQNLQIQEATDTFLTAPALPSNECLPSSSKVHNLGSFNELDCSNTDLPQNMEDRHMITPEIIEEAADFEGLIKGEETSSSVIEENGFETGISNKAEESMQENTNSVASNLSAPKSNDVLLNIRMADGCNLRMKLLLSDSLSVIKDCVDEHQSSGFGSYDLAIPYPRKVFDVQDMRKSLADLGLSDRQALIVVPHRKPKAAGCSSRDGTDPVAGPESGEKTGEGYFGYMKKVLSFFNPFSYSSSGNTTSSSSSQGMLHGGLGLGSSRDGPGPNIGRRIGGGFGDNVHTLKHDEGLKGLDGRNSFWNGNSTQFGGGNDKDN